jgi:hypothetical protein
MVGGVGGRTVLSALNYADDETSVAHVEQGLLGYIPNM